MSKQQPEGPVPWPQVILMVLMIMLVLAIAFAPTLVMAYQWLNASPSRVSTCLMLVCVVGVPFWIRNVWQTHFANHAPQP